MLAEDHVSLEGLKMTLEFSPILPNAFLICQDRLSLNEL